MDKRIDAGRRNLGMAGDVPAGVEQRMRVAPFERTVPDIMNERVYSRAGDVGVTVEVPVGTECRMRIVPGGGALLEIMVERIDPAGGDFGMPLAVPIFVEYAPQISLSDASPLDEPRYGLGPAAAGGPPANVACKASCSLLINRVRMQSRSRDAFAPEL